MPIITPAYPSMCATHNVTLSTKAVILRELKRAGDIVDRIFLKQLTWSDLFARHTFFTNDYKYYLSITASSKTKEAQGIWSGFIESKLRHLVGALDRKASIGLAHPFPKGFERVHTVVTDEQAEEVKNGSTKYQVKNAKTDTPNENANHVAPSNGAENAKSEPAEKEADGGRTLYSTTFYIGLEITPLEPGRMIPNLP